MELCDVLGINIKVLRLIYKQIAENQNAEIFSANTLLVILGTSLIIARASLSMGAFLAVLLLAETEFSLQVESDIAPYQWPPFGSLLRDVMLLHFFPLQIEQGIPILSKWLIFNRFKFFASKGIKLGPTFFLTRSASGTFKEGD